MLRFIVSRIDFAGSRASPAPRPRAFFLSRASDLRRPTEPASFVTAAVEGAYPSAAYVAPATLKSG